MHENTEIYSSNFPRLVLLFIIKGVCLQSLSALARAQCRFIPRPLGSFTRDQEMEHLKEVIMQTWATAQLHRKPKIELATARFDQEPWS